MPLSKNFKPEATPQANREAAQRWLDRAIKLESEDRSKTMIDRALEKACDYETASLS